MGKGLSISEAEALEESSLWVYNRTPQVHKVMGRIALTVTLGNGRASEVVILPTRIPQDLTTQATKKAILESPEFRKLFSRGIIEIVTSASVAKEISTKEYQAEYNRANRITTAATDNSQNNEEESAGILQEQELNPHAVNIAAMAATEEDVAYSMLMNNLDTYSVEDLQYVVNNSRCAKVKTAAAAEVLKR